MKKTSAKKLQLGKIKIASLSQVKSNGMYTNTFKVCTDDLSQGAPICSVDSCRF
jgi:hypothetical protein